MTLNFFIFFIEAISAYFLISAPSDVNPYFHIFENGMFPFFLFIFISVLFVVWIEAFFLRWMTKEKNWKKPVRTTLLSHFPWLLTWSYPFFLRMNLPEPHDFELRKIEILLGIILITHVFLFTRFLLAGSYKKLLRNSTVFGFVSAFLFVGVTFWTATVCDLSGDEPHYLLMAQSLIRDGDLDLSNNYQNKDYLQFYHRGDLQPQALEHVIDGKRYSHHPLGSVLLVLLGFAIAGRLGAALTMALLAALALYLTLRVMEETGSKGVALWAAGAIGLFSSPLLLFSGLIYPEIPTACLVALSLLLFIKKRWGWFGVVQGAMLWMHNRNVLLVIPFLLFAVWEIAKIQFFPLWLRIFKKGNVSKDIGKLLVGFAVPVIVLTAYFYHIYGVLTPLGAHNEPFTSLFRLSHFWDGFFGLLMDQECGLWFHFPIFGLVLMGGAALYRSKNPLRFMALGVLGFYYFFMCFYENLGLTPATRYWVGVTPLLLFVLYPAIEKMKLWDVWARLTVLSFAVGVLVNWLLAAVPWMRYNKLNGENWILKIAGHFLHSPLTAMNPAFQAPVVEMKSYIMSAIPMAITLALTIRFLKDKKIVKG